MGQVVKLNLAILTKLIVRLAANLLKSYVETTNKKRKFDVVIFRSYLVVTCVISLRGSKGLMLDLTVVNYKLKNKNTASLV